MSSPGPNTANSGSCTAPKKSKKVRKGQTDEEFLAQKTQFFKDGPFINSEDWLYDATTENSQKELNEKQKADRVIMLHAVEREYYSRNYLRCLELIHRAEVLFDVSDEETTEHLEHEYQSAGIVTKKSAKIEKHILELLQIKEKCLKRLAEAEASE
ncbi:hypothetical protein CLIB1423_23S00496 [[Candida] railenensis]|uniref:Uncharacterized protein n=1 Tax=[Candida] railenensis TaxID=45579 RepID=A0A9P0QVR2_9ASCO|nr:hypothetical protein CLIB1423_23S00496 [[Candida] railenensis]